MPANSNASLKLVEEIGFDRAVKEIEQLKNVTISIAQGATVYSGVHPAHGAIHIVVPGLGGGMLLFPFAIHDF